MHNPGTLRSCTFIMAAIVGLLAVTLCSVAFADNIPHKISYQGRLLDASGEPITGSVHLRFAIYYGPSGGDALWSELYPSIEVADGLFKVTLGAVNPIPDSAFFETYCFLGIKVGADEELTPRTRLVSVPYAYRISSVDGSEGGMVSGNVTLIPGDVSASLVVVGSSGDSVVIDPSLGYALYVTDENGDLRYELNMSSSDASASFFDPVDVKGPGIMGVGQKKASLSNNGIILFGDSEIDTNVIIEPDGNVTGRGRLTMGHNSTGSTNWSTVLGYSNTASGDSSTVSGGYNNEASGKLSVVSGGAGNYAVGQCTSVGGGVSNLADTAYATVGGGIGNVAEGFASAIAGGDSNDVAGNYSFSGGGKSNIANGHYSAILGGRDNAAIGDYSFAIGAKAKANHDGSIVIAANSTILSGDSIRSAGLEQLVIRADSGVYITNSGGIAEYDVSKLINTSTGAYLSNGGAWQDNGTRDMKENFQELDGAELLRKVCELPVTFWNYRAESDAVKHIGPTAQDFYHLFGVGIDEKSISSSDLAAVALVAAQELKRENERLSEEVAELRVLVQSLLKKQ